jgi:hypothetical protein
MAEKNERDAAVDENPYRSPNAPLSSPEKPPDQVGKRGNSGCLISLLLAIPILDAFGYQVSLAGRYGPNVILFGLCGFACGALLGAYVSTIIKHQHWWASCRWAIYGLIGMFLLAGIGYYVIAILFLRPA